MSTDVTLGKAEVTYDPSKTNLKKLQAAIKDAGYGIEQKEKK